MYESNGEKYFVVDAHMHYWNAGPDNWVPGAEKYAEGWIKCFHAYQGLGPPATHWSLEHFETYSEDDLMKDVFEDGHVDVAIFQPTYLKEWYKEGFNTTERNALMGEKHPGKFIYNTRFDPRDGDPGLEELKRNVERFGSKGFKLYTAEWNNGSRGYKLSDPAAYRFLEAAQNLGIKNVHVHKGPTIWPLDKDAFDVSDIDHCATDFPDLNFIIEHERPDGDLHRCGGWCEGIPRLHRTPVQLLHPGRAQADALRGRHRRGPAGPEALPQPGLAVRVLRRPRRLPAGLDRAEGVGQRPAGAQALPRLGRQGLRLARAGLARVPRPERGVGTHPVPLQRQRGAAAEPEHPERPAGQGVRRVEPELDPVRGAQRGRLDARRPGARALPVR